MSYLVFHRSKHWEASVLEKIKYPVPFCVTASPKRIDEIFLLFLNTRLKEIILKMFSQIRQVC